MHTDLLFGIDQNENQNRHVFAEFCFKNNLIFLEKKSTFSRHFWPKLKIKKMKKKHNIPPLCYRYPTFATRFLLQVTYIHHCLQPKIIFYKVNSWKQIFQLHALQASWLVNYEVTSPSTCFWEQNNKMILNRYTKQLHWIKGLQGWISILTANNKPNDPREFGKEWNKSKLFFSVIFFTLPFPNKISYSTQVLWNRPCLNELDSIP